jgi:hypothetical protein
MKLRAVLLVFLCSTLHLRASAQDGAAIAESPTHPWQMRNATAARTGQSASVGATLGQLEWRFPTAGSVPQIAVAQDGSIYLGTVFNENEWNNESYAYALTGAGALKWRQKVTSTQWSAGQGTKGGPALDDAGSVYIPSTFTQLVKLSSEGDPISVYQGNNQALSQGSPAVLPDQTIRHTISPAGLLALDSAGTTLFIGSPAPQNSGATVSVAGNGDMALSGVRTIEPHGSIDIQYFNANGTLRWQKTSTYGALGTPVFGDGVVYAPFLGKAFLPDGTVKWTTDVTSFTAALSDQGVLYFPSAGVVAVDAATGTRFWTVPITGGVLQDPAIDALGNVFVTTLDGKLWSVSPTGGINWSLQVCDKFLTGPVVAGGRVVAAGLTRYQKFVFAVR